MFSVDVHWLIADRVILGELCGDGDLDCCPQTLARIKDPHEMFVVASRFRRHPNMGRIILVTQNPAIRLSGRILAQYLGAPFHAVNTMPQALTILRRVDPTLDFSRRTAVA